MRAHPIGHLCHGKANTWSTRAIALRTPQDAASPRSICSRERNQAEQYSKRRLGMRWVGEGKEVQGGLGITKPPSKTVCEPSAVYSPKSDNLVTCVKLCAGATLPGALPMGLILLNCKMRASRTATQASTCRKHSEHHIMQRTHHPFSRQTTRQELSIGMFVSQACSYHGFQECVRACVRASHGLCAHASMKGVRVRVCVHGGEAGLPHRRCTLGMPTANRRERSQ
jgi:hypothetical protein